MRRFILCVTAGAGLLLGACGGPGEVQNSLNEAASAVSEVEGTLNEIATAVSGPTGEAALNEMATIVSGPTGEAALNELATAVSAPEVATAVAEAAGELSAVADDVTLQQGEQLVLDATQSVGDIQNYTWTVVDAPAGAESVEGQVISESSNGNLSLEPSDYQQYFPTAGTYTVRLTVTDASGATNSTDFTVDVP